MLLHKTTLLLVGACAIYLLGLKSDWVETYYSMGLYPVIANIQRILFGWIKFSMGDVLYTCFGIYLLILLVKFSYKLIIYPNKKHTALKGLLYCLNFVLVLYMVFKLLWGLNYNRQGIASQLSIRDEYYCKEQLDNLVNNLINEANELRQQISDTSLPVITVAESFTISKQAYKNIINKGAFRLYQHSIKPSLFSSAGNYLGFTGYYNPFTGEAQVRDDIPSILLPFINCHEMAHQLGYASEAEANFMAYVVATNSNNIYLRYSMCLDILDYCLADLPAKYIEDNELKKLPERIKQISKRMNVQIAKDRTAIKNFFLKNRKQTASFSMSVYDKYLKANGSTMGISSYDKVVGLVITYREKIE